MNVFPSGVIHAIQPGHPDARAYGWEHLGDFSAFAPSDFGVQNHGSTTPCVDGRPSKDEISAKRIPEWPSRSTGDSLRGLGRYTIIEDVPGPRYEIDLEPSLQELQPRFHRLDKPILKPIDKPRKPWEEYRLEELKDEPSRKPSIPYAKFPLITLKENLNSEPDTGIPTDGIHTPLHAFTGVTGEQPPQLEDGRITKDYAARVSQLLANFIQSVDSGSTADLFRAEIKVAINKAAAAYGEPSEYGALVENYCDVVFGPPTSGNVLKVGLYGLKRTVQLAVRQ